MYPLGMAEPTGANADAHRFFFPVKEELCHGHGQGAERTVRDFVASQGVESYDIAQVSFRQLLAAVGEKKRAVHGRAVRHVLHGAVRSGSLPSIRV